MLSLAAFRHNLFTRETNNARDSQVFRQTNFALSCTVPCAGRGGNDASGRRFRWHLTIHLSQMMPQSPGIPSHQIKVVVPCSDVSTQTNFASSGTVRCTGRTDERENDGIGNVLSIHLSQFMPQSFGVKSSFLDSLLFSVNMLGYSENLEDTNYFSMRPSFSNLNPLDRKSVV